MAGAMGLSSWPNRWTTTRSGPRSSPGPCAAGKLALGERPALPTGSQLYDSHSVPMVLRQYGLGYHGEAGPDEWHLRVFDSGASATTCCRTANYGYLEHLINAFAAVVISICVLGAFLIGRRGHRTSSRPSRSWPMPCRAGGSPFPQDARDEIGVLAVPSPGTDELERFPSRAMLQRRCQP